MWVHIDLKLYGLIAKYTEDDIKPLIMKSNASYIPALEYFFNEDTINTTQYAGWDWDEIQLRRTIHMVLLCLQYYEKDVNGEFFRSNLDFKFCKLWRELGVMTSHGSREWCTDNKLTEGQVKPRSMRDARTIGTTGMGGTNTCKYEGLQFQGKSNEPWTTQFLAWCTLHTAVLY